MHSQKNRLRFGDVFYQKKTSAKWQMSFISQLRISYQGHIKYM